MTRRIDHISKLEHPALEGNFDTTSAYFIHVRRFENVIYRVYTSLHLQVATLRITVSAGAHFPKSDVFGKCDAYCTVTHGDFT